MTPSARLPLRLPLRLRLLGLAQMGALLLGACGGGGGGSTAASPAPAPTPAPAAPLTASHLAVLIAEGDANSEAIALAYQRARGIPDAQMVRVSIPGAASDSISAADFSTLKAAIDAKLTADVQATLITWMRPSRVLGSCSMGITSAMALGYAARWCGGCEVTATSPYYNADTRRPWTDLRIRPSMMLGASTLAEAQALIARGVAADGSWAGGGTTGQAFLVRSSDTRRSSRASDFQTLSTAVVPGLTMRYIDNSAGTGSDEISGQSRVMFYFTGLETLSRLASNSYLPGAVGDSLTSFGGVLPDGLGQTPVTDWLKAGLSGSYGTVEEPCNHVEKFPRASVLLSRYRRGESLIEAYWKSVQWPGQGLFVGEPLARPWATP